MKNLFFLTLLSHLAFAGPLSVVSSPYEYQSSPEYQAILGHLKSFGEFSPKMKTADVPQSQGRGERLVEEARARNRALLKKMRKEESELEEKTQGLGQLEKWKLEEKKTLESWKKQTRDLHASWKKDQEIFLGRLKIYKENTFKLPVKEEKIIEKKISLEAIPEVFLVNGTFKVPMRNQMGRPTCVAFAGIRAIEILLAQNGFNFDLSEQYLYWAGKPDCQKAPCSTKGSWIREAFGFSRRQPMLDIPLENNCTYETKSLSGNETQIPLGPGCREGVVKIKNFEEIRTIADVVEKIKKNIPVVVATKLSENFYKNKGLVTLEESFTNGQKLDRHSLGHAYLAVGVMELPEKLKSKEGNFCLVVANSWGKGWGAGGYSCVTEKWFEKFRQKSPFIALTEIQVL